jgi:hypothetical protein
LLAKSGRALGEPAGLCPSRMGLGPARPPCQRRVLGRGLATFLSAGQAAVCNPVGLGFEPSCSRGSGLPHSGRAAGAPRRRCSLLPRPPRSARALQRLRSAGPLGRATSAPEHRASQAPVLAHAHRRNAPAGGNRALISPSELPPPSGTAALKPCAFRPQEGADPGQSFTLACSCAIVSARAARAPFPESFCRLGLGAWMGAINLPLVPPPVRAHENRTPQAASVTG